MLVQAGVLFQVFLVVPLIGLLFPLAIFRQRELLADADAVLLPRDPSSLYIAEPVGTARWWNRLFSTHPPARERIELLAGMGDGILPERVERGEAEEGGALLGVPVTTETLGTDAAATQRETGVGVLDAFLYGIAAGTVAVAVLTVANYALMLLSSGGYHPIGPVGPFNISAALASGFSARKRGTAIPMALGFALLVFLFPWIFLAPLIPFMPDPFPNPDRPPLPWIAWSLTTDLFVVSMAAVTGASIDRWTPWVKTVFRKVLPGPSR